MSGVGGEGVAEGKSGKRPTRILMVAPVLGGVDYFGGIPSSVKAYMDLCEDMGLEVRTVTGIRIRGLYYENNLWTRQGVRIATRVGWCTGLEFIKCMQDVKWADIIFIHAWFHVMARFASWLANKANKPWVLVPHGTLMSSAVRQRNWRKMCELYFGGRKRLKSARLILLATSFEKKLSHPIIQTEIKIDIVPPPSYPRPKVFLKLAKNEKRFRVGFLGRFHNSKRLDLMLEACRQSIGTNIEFDLVLAGPDEQNLAESFSDQYADIFTCERASFLRPVSGIEKCAFLAGLDVLILLSAFESYGLVIIEGWAQGTPCLVTRTVGLADEVERHQGGYVIGDPSVPSILRGLLELKNNLNEGRISKTLLQTIAVDFGEKLPKEGLRRGVELCGFPFPQVVGKETWH